MSKTAISVLQEYLQKKSYNLPTYTLIDQLGPQHEISFTFRVSFDSYCADGTAKTKKAAKHNAASAMIKLLNTHYGHNIDYDQKPSINILPTQPIQEQNTKPHNSKLPYLQDNQLMTSASNNLIGKLQEICVKLKMKSPEYEECHSQLQDGFTFLCKLGNIIHVATAPSKKQAKQKSAEFMIQYLIEKKLVADDVMIESQNQINYDTMDNINELIMDVKIAESTEKAKKLFPSMQKNVGITNEEKNELSVANFHNQFRNSFDPADIEKFLTYYKTLNFDEFRCSISHSESILTKIENILHIKTEKKNMKIDGFNEFVVSIEFLSKPAPVFKEIGRGKSYSEAYLTALIRTITGIHLLLL